MAAHAPRQRSLGGCRTFTLTTFPSPQATQNLHPSHQPNSNVTLNPCIKVNLHLQIQFNLNLQTAVRCALLGRSIRNPALTDRSTSLIARCHLRLENLELLLQLFVLLLKRVFLSILRGLKGGRLLLFRTSAASRLGRGVVLLGLLLLLWSVEIALSKTMIECRGGRWEATYSSSTSEAGSLSTVSSSTSFVGGDWGFLGAMFASVERCDLKREEGYFVVFDGSFMNDEESATNVNLEASRITH